MDICMIQPNIEEAAEKYRGAARITIWGAAKEPYVPPASGNIWRTSRNK